MYGLPDREYLLVTTNDGFSVPSDTGGDGFSVPSDAGFTTPRESSESRAAVPRDQWGRYLLPRMDGSKPAPTKGATRVTTTAGALSNTEGLQKWGTRRALEGVGKSPELAAQVMKAAALPEGKEREQALGRVAQRAYELGGGNERSGKGTEMHQLLEDRHRGIQVTIPPERVKDVAAFDQMLIDNDITVLPEYLEVVVTCPYDQAGTIDNIVKWWNPDTAEYELIVADLKTGKSLELAKLEIAIQLWLYANALSTWETTHISKNDPKDPDRITGVEGFHTPMPYNLRTDLALVLHVPLDGTAHLYKVDLSGVDRYVRTALEAKRANAEAKNKWSLVSSVVPDAFVGAPSMPAPAPEPPAKAPIDFDKVRAMTRPLAENGTRPPTADQQAQVDKAKERMAVLEKGKNASTGEEAAASPLTHDPVTGRKKRTCGHCHQPGHTQKNCPQNPSSAKYNPDFKVGDTTTVEGIGFTKHSEGPTEFAHAPTAEVPYCTMPHTCQWTSSPPALPGQWGCTVSGKPSKAAWESGQTAVTKEAPFYGAPVDNTVVTPDVVEVLAPEWATDPTATSEYGINASLTAATTRLAILEIRTASMKAGTWNENLETLARNSYNALV